MVKIEESVMINRPLDEVWKFISDISKVPKWNTLVQEARQTSTGPVGVGRTFRIKSSNMVADVRVIEYEPNRKLTDESTSEAIKGTIDSLSVDTVEGKTKLTRKGDMKFSGFYKLVGPFMTPRMKSAFVASLGNIKRILESEA